MSVDILGTNFDQCLSMVQCCFTSTETVRLIRTEIFTQLLNSEKRRRRRRRSRSGATIRPQELCETQGGRPGLTVPNSLYGLCGRKTTLKSNSTDKTSCTRASTRPVCLVRVPPCHGTRGDGASLGEGWGNIDLDLQNVAMRYNKAAGINCMAVKSEGRTV